MPPQKDSLTTVVVAHISNAGESEVSCLDLAEAAQLIGELSFTSSIVFTEKRRAGRMQQVLAVEYWQGNLANAWLVTSSRHRNLLDAFGYAALEQGLTCTKRDEIPDPAA